MKSKNLYQPVEIVVSSAGDWKENILVYHFFEILQIVEGAGMREVNENHFSYGAGDVFLFTPLDCRGFTSSVPTRFCSIRFSEQFLTGYKSKAEQQTISAWLHQLENLFYQHNRFEKFVMNDMDAALVTGFVNSLVSEYERKQMHYEDNVRQLTTLILNTMARNVTTLPSINHSRQNEEPLINRMLLHIKEHIGSKEKLSIKYLAGEFNLSANYVGEYFRKVTGESIQQYTMIYKMRLVENKLRYSGLTIGQIADELGFSDESHLSSQFKKYSGHSPLQFRKLQG